MELTLTQEQMDRMTPEEISAFVDKAVAVIVPKLLEVTTLGDISPRQAKVAGYAIAAVGATNLGDKLEVFQIMSMLNENERALFIIMCGKLGEATAAVHRARSESQA